jgi:hypothetical protein
MGSATQKAKPRREAVSEPGGKRVSNSCLGSAKKEKSLPFIHASNKTGESQKKVLTRFWHFRYKQRSTQIPSTS